MDKNVQSLIPIFGPKYQMVFQCRIRTEKRNPIELSRDDEILKNQIRYFTRADRNTLNHIIKCLFERNLFVKRDLTDFFLKCPYFSRKESNSLEIVFRNSLQGWKGIYKNRGQIRTLPCANFQQFRILICSLQK